MKIYALSDLHLALGTPRKSMAVFGDHWKNHEEKLSRAWKEIVGEEDLVLIAGDISWAMKLDGALPDLQFIASLPGRKVLVRGNHDYWWSSPSKVRAALPEGIFILHNDALEIDGAALSGTRLWIDHDMGPIRMASRDPMTDKEGKTASVDPAGGLMLAEEDLEQDEKIYQRELNRLQLSLSNIDQTAEVKIAMVHFPPLATDLKETRATRPLEEAGVHHCVFGHLHNLKPSSGHGFYGCRKGITYHLTSCDYLDFIPALIAQI
ncbi:MAG: metallophosphoesterase [Planctomycetota bacterium]|jgi:predicted phosphohydrolase